MKKLIALLAVVSITGVSATSVVSCGVKVDPIEIYFGDAQKSIKQANYNLEGVGYSAKDLAGAVEGSSYQYKTAEKKPTVITSAMSFNQLNDMLFRVVANDPRSITKPQKNQQQLQNARDVFIGRLQPGEEVLPKGIYTPSVDGSRIPSLETDIDTYYSKFDNTYINSINGLHDLHGYDIKDSQNQALITSKQEADDLFKDTDPTVKDFYASYYTSTKYSKFLGIRYELGGGNSTDFFKEYNTMSSTFDLNKRTGEMTAPVNYQSYADVNKVKPEDVIADKQKVITSRTKSDPFGRLLISSSNLDLIEGTASQGKLKLVDGSDDDGLPKNTKFAEKFSSDANISYVKQKKEITENNQKVSDYSFIYNPSTFYYAKVDPIKVTYSFAPNTKESKTEYYNISFTLNNLIEVFTPLVQTVAQTDAEKEAKIQKYQIIWIFDGYKFVDNQFVQGIYDQQETVNTESSEDKTYLKNIQYELNHQLRDLKTTNWQITKS